MKGQTGTIIILNLKHLHLHLERETMLSIGKVALVALLISLVIPAAEPIKLEDLSEDLKSVFSDFHVLDQVLNLTSRIEANRVTPTIRQQYVGRQPDGSLFNQSWVEYSEISRMDLRFILTIFSNGSEVVIVRSPSELYNWPIANTLLKSLIGTLGIISNLIILKMRHQNKSHVEPLTYCQAIVGKLSPICSNFVLLKSNSQSNLEQHLDFLISLLALSDISILRNYENIYEEICSLKGFTQVS